MRVVLSLGSNLEPRAEYLTRALRGLSAFPQTHFVSASSVRETEGVEVPREYAALKFLNQVAVFETALGPLDFSRRMHALEETLGRVRTVRNGPRTIDLDIIDFGGLVSDDPELTLPHPRAAERDFVLQPLAELGLDLMPLERSWRRVLYPEFEKPYFKTLQAFVREAYAAGPCYPPAALVYRAFNRTPFEKVKVVILGQDPYHEPGQAQGLAFYVPPEVRTPPSLVNIAKELGAEPDLLSWADQGVLLLNATLTVAAHRPLSHRGRGWETLTDAVIRALAEGREHLVFILWGSHAQKKGAFIDRKRHCVIASPHPSPLSAYRGFFGSQPFSRANAYLRANGLEEIVWGKR